MIYSIRIRVNWFNHIFLVAMLKVFDIISFVFSLFLRKDRSMRKSAIILLTGILMCLMLTGCLENSQNAGWTTLIQNKVPADWIQRGDPKALYTVKNGVLTGSTNNNRNNAFLCTARDYSDFILEFDFKLGDPDLNSGVQIRSLSTPSYKNGRVHGYQVEIDGSLTNKKDNNLNADGSSAADQPRSWTGGI